MHYELQINVFQLYDKVLLKINFKKKKNSNYETLVDQEYSSLCRSGKSAD